MSAASGIRVERIALRRRCPLLLAATVLAIVLSAAGAARADVFSSIGLVSYGEVGGDGFEQQAEYAHDAAISATGRYVVFDGAIGGVTGVWRRDLVTKAVEQVAGGDAAMPSISKEGRYVSFTTNEGTSLPEITDALPDAQPHAEAVNVYRRDMDNEPAATAAEEAEREPAERAFQAASVPSGSEGPLRYANLGNSGGSYAVGRSAMSASGNEVAFVTASISNLVSYPALEEEESGRGETPVPHTPAGQVAVHWFDSDTTELVSRCRFECGQGAAAGAAEPVVVGEVPSESKVVGAVSLAAAKFPNHARAGAWPGASISADGSTVAWMGEDIAPQAPTLADEDLEPAYEEPLWRRLPAVDNETRRVTGGSDPEAPGCAASGEPALAVDSENASDPCQGPFVREEASGSSGGGLIKGEADDVTPRLSANGEEVAFGANSRLVAEGSDFNRGEQGNPTDLFVVSMRSGLTRTQALTPVTQVGSPASKAESEEVADFEISPDGQQVAFSTARTRFALGQPTLVSLVSGEIGIGELYDADLADGTLTRVTHGFAGEGEQSQQRHPTGYQQGGDPYSPYNPDELGALTPDFSENGDRLVFTSTAGNLIYGDGNSPETPVDCCQPGDGSDVFAVSRIQFSAESTSQSISPSPLPAIAPLWQLGVSAHSLANGRVLLYVQAPGSGEVKANATGWVLVQPANAARSARKKRPHRASTARRTVAARTVATRSAQAKGAGLTTLGLALASPYAALADARGGFSATVTVIFQARGRATLRASIPVTFLAKSHRGKRSKARSAKSHRRSSNARRRA
jgi:hypothetical protein